MSILSAQTLFDLQPIHPFRDKYKFNGLSGGLSATTYDVAVAETFWMWPGRFKLASTMESFEMPNYVCATVHDKSTWARRGLFVQNTFIDPGWKGFLTLELTMHGLKPIRIEAGTPIAQILFHFLDEPTSNPYDGKYQHQEAGPVKPRES